jgi:adenylate cyclase
MDRRLAAILVADVVGFSRLMGIDEARTLAVLQGLRKDLVDPKVLQHGGRIVKSTGDGILVEFSSVIAAVECAAAIQQAMAERNRDVAGDERVEFRIGVNVDEIIIEHDDIFGDGVNTAARLENFADPGTVCVSGTVFEQVKNRIQFHFEELGYQRFKNIAEPIRVFRLNPLLETDRPKRVIPMVDDLPLPTKPSIAVMPFADLSGAARGYFADGLRLDIQAALIHASGLFLIAPGTINKYRDAGTSAQQAGRELGVRYILEGAAHRSGRRIRINVELTDIVARQVVWAEHYDRTVEDEFGVRDEITAEVVKALDVKLASGERSLVHSSLRNLEALVARFNQFERI